VNAGGGKNAGCDDHYGNLLQVYWSLDRSCAELRFSVEHLGLRERERETQGERYECPTTTNAR
jgi:hypothetical protein